MGPPGRHKSKVEEAGPKGMTLKGVDNPASVIAARRSYKERAAKRQAVGSLQFRRRRRRRTGAAKGVPRLRTGSTPSVRRTGSSLGRGVQGVNRFESEADLTKGTIHAQY